MRGIPSDGQMLNALEFIFSLFTGAGYQQYLNATKMLAVYK
jgi:hypothetical protein